MNSLNEEQIIRSMRRLRRMPIDPHATQAAVERARAVVPAPSHSMPSGRAGAWVGLFAVSAAALVLVSVYVASPEAPPEPIPASPQPISVAIPAAEELKSAVLQSLQYPGPVHVRQVMQMADTTAPVGINSGASQRVFTNELFLTPSQPTIPSGQIRPGVAPPPPDSGGPQTGFIPITWGRVQTVPIPLDWPNLQIKPLLITSQTKVARRSDGSQLIFEIHQPQSPAMNASPSSAGGTVWVNRASGLIDRIQLQPAGAPVGSPVDLIYQYAPTPTSQPASPTPARLNR